MKRRIIYATGIITVAFVGLLLMEKILPEKTKQEITANISLLSHESPKLGKDTAPVLVTNFLDPECDNCAKINSDLQLLARTHPYQVQVQVRYVFRHRNSKLAAMALESARAQGKYWEMMNLLHTRTDWVHKKEGQEEKMEKFAVELGLDLARYKSDLKNSGIMLTIQKDLELAKSLGIKRAPLIFVGSKSLPVDNYLAIESRVKEELVNKGIQR